jgi:hypothetical protein
VKEKQRKKYFQGPKEPTSSCRLLCVLARERKVKDHFFNVSSSHSLSLGKSSKKSKREDASKMRGEKNFLFLRLLDA